MSPLLHEHQHDLSIVPGFVERALAAPFRLGVMIGLPCPSPSSLLVLYRGLFAFAGVLALTFAFRSVGMPRALAVLAAFWTYVDPGVLPYKPLVGLLWPTFVFDRFSNPLVGVPVFFVAWGCLARALLDEEHWLRWSVIGGVAAGLLFYVSFYYWTLFVATAAVSFLPEPRRRFRPLAVTLGVAAVSSAGYWPYAFSFQASPYYPDILWRTDFCTPSRGVCFNANRTMWLFVLGALAAWRVGTPGARLLVMSVVGGMACFYSGLVTGMDMPNSLQNAHWNVVLAPMLLAGCLWTLDEWVGRLELERFRATAYRVLATALAVGGIVVFVRFSRSLATPDRPGVGQANVAYEPAWEWLRKNAPPDAVVLASEQTMGYVPLRAGNYIWIDQYVYPDPVSFVEILERYRVLWALEGLGARDVEEVLRSRFGKKAWFWGWGLTSQLVEELREDGWPPLDPLRWRLLTRTVVDLVAKTTADDVRKIGSRYKVDYVIRGPNERRWATADSHLSLVPVFRTRDVRIDRVASWRDPARANAAHTDAEEVSR
jgi:hypothetical protein